MYADDTQITVTAQSVDELERLLNKDVANVNIWLNANKLAANSTKTEFIVIASDYRLKQLLRNPKVKIDHEVIKRVSKAKLLGVVIDEKLSWEDHINEIIIPKVLKGLRMLRELRSILTFSQMISLYQALVLPHFDFCSTIWGNCGIMLKKKLQKLQSRGLLMRGIV